LSIKGAGFHLEKPVFSIKDKASNKINEIAPDYLEMKPISSVIISPSVSFKEDGKTTNMLEFRAPITLLIKKLEGGYQLSSPLSEEVVFHFIDEARNIKFNLAKDSLLQIGLSDNYQEISISSPMLKIFFGTDIVRLGNLQATLKENPENALKGKSNLLIISDNITVGDKIYAQDIYKLNLNVENEGTLLSNWKNNIFSDKYKLKLVSDINSPQMKFLISAYVSDEENNPIPKGKITVHTENYPFIYNNILEHIIPAQNRETFKQILAKAVGQEYSNINNFDLEVNSSEDGLKIGKIGAAEVLGLLIKGTIPIQKKQ
jgi:hypothetical protein